MATNDSTATNGPSMNEPDEKFFNQVDILSIEHKKQLLEFIKQQQESPREAHDGEFIQHHQGGAISNL